MRRHVLAALLAASSVPPASARVLEVGAGKAFALPSAAAQEAKDGDTIAISPGTYFDCAFWRASHLTIAATGPGVVLTDRACGGKAAFVISGSDVTVRGIVFTRIRVPDNNGAGIRMEGQDLTVQDSQFINNQAGILAGGTGGTLRIVDCAFSANGVSLDNRPTHAVLAGPLELLRIERSTFRTARGGDHVSSYARHTELVGNRLVDDGDGMAGPMVFASTGALVFDGNVIELTPRAAVRPGAVLATGSVDRIALHDNTLIEPGGTVPLLSNWTTVTPLAGGNVVPDGVLASSDAGATYHRLRATMATLRNEAHGYAAATRRGLGSIARGLNLIP